MLKKRCILFGGGGFIGSYLTEGLINNNYDVLVYARGSNKDYSNLVNVINKITFVKGHINNIKLIKKIVKQNDFVFDLVSSSLPITSMNKPVGEIKYHIYSHVLLAQTTYKLGIEKYIFASSGGGIYGQQKNFPIPESTPILPSSPHAIAKASIEFYLNYFSKIYNIPNLIYRISNPYGARQSTPTGFGIISTIINDLRNNSPPRLFNKGKIIRDFIYIDDLINAMVISFDKKTKYDLYNIGSGQGTSINTVWNILNNLLEGKIKPTYGQKRVIDVDKIILDISRFSKEFRWKPKFDVNMGLKKTLSLLHLLKN